jgi:hypothetical protein
VAAAFEEYTALRELLGIEGGTPGDGAVLCFASTLRRAVLPGAADG